MAAAADALHAAACHKLSEEEIRAMFVSLDRNGDGHLDLDELTMAMKALKLPLGSAAACLLAEADRNKDGFVDFEEFKTLLNKRQQLISDLFLLIDRNKDGRINPEEVRVALADALKIDLSPAEADAMIKRIAPTGGPVSYSKFQAAVSLFPAHTQAELVQLWRTSSSLTFMLYVDAPQPQSSTLILTAGCIAGAVSRSCTAPFDRVSLVLRAGNTVHHNGSGLFGALAVRV